MVWKQSDNAAMTDPSSGDQLIIRDVSVAAGSQTNTISRDMLLAGKKTIGIPAGALTPTASSGAAIAVTSETATNFVNYSVVLFDDGIEEHAFFQFPTPPSWDAGDFTFDVGWVTANSSAQDALWGVKLLARGDGDIFETAYGTEVTIADTAQGAAGEFARSDVSAAVTPGGTPAQSDTILGQITRVASHASDTLVGDAGVIDLRLFYTNSFGTDN